MNIVIVESPAKAKTINKYLGAGLRGSGLVRPCPRPAGQGRLGRSGRQFQDDLGGRRQGRRAGSTTSPGAEGRRQADPRDRPGSRGRSDLLARAGSAEGKERAQGPDDRARGVQRHHQAGRHRGDEEPAPDRRRAGRRLSGAPRARLSGRLHALAGAVAQAAGRALGRPRAVGRAAAGLRPRARDREVRRRANTGRWSRRWRRRAATPSRRGSSAPTARRSSGSTSAPARKPKTSRRRSKPPHFTVATVEAKPARRNPHAPFTTSTLQQEASRKLGFAPAHTMRIAQRLYEGIDIGGETIGLITYMRTDGVQIDGGGDHAGAPGHRRGLRQGTTCRTRRASTRPRRRTRRKRTKRSARPICRAARPTMRKRLDTDQARLYELIWLRTIASQMESAELERTTVDIAAKAGAPHARPARHRHRS